jgi:NADH-quinone oxidoreductase subunit F
MKLFSTQIIVPVDSNSVLQGALEVKHVLEELIGKYNLASQVSVVETGALGIYDQGVVLAVFPDDVYYGGVKPTDVEEIVTEHLLKGRVVSRLTIDRNLSSRRLVEKETGKRQQRIVLRNAGLIDPQSVDEYIARDGYGALAKALAMKPDEVIQILCDSTLQGRGGAGFPTGLKWGMVAKEQSDEKYIVCNADEGEPGTFKDRLILEGDPHCIVEAMTIAGYATGAHVGIVYVRGEYFMSIARIRKAIKDAAEYGLLGKDVLGTGFQFDIEVYRGGGAYVCGEEFALLESIENQRGEPRNKPPFPPQHGLFGKPTVVNNVETFANVPPILLNGSDWFKSFGTPSSAGTKVFSLSGDIVNRGIVEAPLGITLRELIYDFGGGLKGGKRIGFIQTGGSAGTVLTDKYLDTPLDFASMKTSNLSIGSGVILVASEDVPLLPFLEEVAHFFWHESCGKCTPCREGTRQVKTIMEALASRTARPDANRQLGRLLTTLSNTSFCGLGQAVPLAFESALRNFPEVFDRALAESHVPEACQEEA